MSKTVYVEITNNYSRTVWDSTGATTYAIGDRVEYNDGSRNIIFVCIAGNNSTTNPDTNTSDWVEAGSEEYPFLVLDGSNNMSGAINSEWHWYGHTAQDKNFLVESIGSWTQGGNNNYWQASAPGATIVLGDGRYSWTNSTYSISGLPSDSTIVAKNNGKAYLMTNTSYWGGDNVTLKDLVIYPGDTWVTAPGCYSGIYNMYGCLLTQETPWGTLYPLKQESSDERQGRPFQSWKGGIVQNCTFDYSYKGPSYWFNHSPVGIVENNTFYCRVKQRQYSLFQGPQACTFKNNIFYIKELSDTHGSQNLLSTGTLPTEGENIFYIENNLSASSGSITNNTNFQEINPLFIDANDSNFSLRPSSPLIGGLKSDDILSDKYPEGLWVDHSHIPVQSSYSYTLDSGDGTNYTFSGDATGTDPTLNANIQDTLTFTNSTGGHPLAIYNSQGLEVASESSGTTTFTPKYPDTYYYQCTVSGHENMRGNIVVSMGTLGTTSNPFSNYQHAIDAKAYTGSCDLLFKEGDHPMNGGGGPDGLTFESSYPNGIRFIGSSAKSTRLVTLDAINSWPMLHNSTSGNDTNGTISGSDFYFINIGIHLNNTTSYINRGILGVFRNLTLDGCVISATSTANVNGSLISAPSGWFEATGSIFNTPLGKSPGGDMWWIGHSYGITRYRIESCCFLNLSGYHRATYENDAFFGITADSNSYFKNNIVYTDVANCRYVVSSGANLDAGYWVANWTGNSYYNSAVAIGNAPNTLSGDNVVQDPLFIDLATENEDFRLRPDSPLIGGISSLGSITQTGIFYVDFTNGDDANDGTTASNAFKTLTAAHSASIHLDTIVIVDKHVSLTARLSLPGGRKYKPLTHCTIDGNNSWAVQIYDTADVDTYVSNFNFINLRGTNISYDDYGLINVVSSNSNSLFVFEGCYIDGIVTVAKSAAIGGSAYAGCRLARDGSLLKNCTLNVGWAGGGTAGSNSQGFVAINYTDLIGCTFYVKDSTPLGMSSLFLVGQGGVGSWSHGPPLGPVIVKDCIVHGNNRLSYTSGNSGAGLDLGFVSNSGVTTSNANYVVYNTCFYNMTGATPTFNRGAIAVELGISNPSDTLFFTDPKFVNPAQGSFQLRPNSPLISN